MWTGIRPVQKEDAILPNHFSEYICTLHTKKTSQSAIFIQSMQWKKTKSTFIFSIGICNFFFFFCFLPGFCSFFRPASYTALLTYFTYNLLIYTVIILNLSNYQIPTSFLELLVPFPIYHYFSSQRDITPYNLHVVWIIIDEKKQSLDFECPVTSFLIQLNQRLF